MIIGNTTLTLTEEQGMLMDVAREFCRDKSPVSAVREQLDTELGYDAGVWKEMITLGWTGIALPEHCGGSGLGVSALVPVFEAMGRALLGTPLLTTSLAAQLVMRAAGAAQESVLADIAGGKIATLALTEDADWGREHFAVSLDKNGTLSGMKRFVPDAAVAELFVVPVQREGELVIALVGASQLPAGAIRPNTLIDETKRAANVDFTGVSVDENSVISGGQVVNAINDTRLIGALLVAAEATGSAGACLDTIVDYLKTRKQFGKLIGSYQALKHPTVDILIDTDSSRSFIYHAAAVVGDETLDRDGEIACRMAKAQATDTLLQAGDRAIQFHGGMGFTYECNAQLYLRRAQWSQQQFGDAQHHRTRLAKLLLD